jgi:tRNA threonylcarbamoyl adenosine modification protein YeaZ
VTGGRPRSGSSLLALDTATRQAVVAVDDGEGRLLATETWVAGHLHGERLLASVLAVLQRAGLGIGEVGAIVAGTGPGSFTGMRVGLATAKGLAFGLGVPVVGVSTAVALAAASAPTSGTVVLVQPAGPSGRYVTVLRLDAGGGAAIADGPSFLASDRDVAIPTGAREVAVDLPAADADASAAGDAALAGLAEALVRLGRERLASTGPDDLADLAPAYVTLPRGAAAPVEGIRWSSDPR